MFNVEGEKGACGVGFEMKESLWSYGFCFVSKWIYWFCLLEWYGTFEAIKAHKKAGVRSSGKLCEVTLSGPWLTAPCLHVLWVLATRTLFKSWEVKQEGHCLSLPGGQENNTFKWVVQEDHQWTWSSAGLPRCASLPSWVILKSPRHFLNPRHPIFTFPPGKCSHLAN